MLQVTNTTGPSHKAPARLGSSGLSLLSAPGKWGKKKEKNSCLTYSVTIHRLRRRRPGAETLERISTGLSGEGDSNAVPFPRPLLLSRRYGNAFTKAEAVSKKLCHLRGSP